MAKSGGSGYLGTGHLLSIILAIIPITSLILGIVVRFQKKKYLGAILNFILFPLFWLIDLITIVLNNKLSFLA
ncbi:MAG TPA: hypothetical protein VJZ69_04210 [Clostridia bacterium]|nr:hypothetical protein [Clostridia bacterium]